jgi:hypothetical protein
MPGGQIRSCRSRIRVLMGQAHSPSAIRAGSGIGRLRPRRRRASPWPGCGGLLWRRPRQRRAAQQRPSLGRCVGCHDGGAHSHGSRSGGVRHGGARLDHCDGGRGGGAHSPGATAHVAAARATPVLCTMAPGGDRDTRFGHLHHSCRPRSGLLPFLRGLAEVLAKAWTATSDAAPSLEASFCTSPPRARCCG